MGLPACVYRTGATYGDGHMIPRDCTLNGWSAKFDRVCVVNAEGPFDPTEDCPGVIVVKHPTMHTLHVVSVEHHARGVWTMFGGNLLSCSDSRFGELIGKLLGREFQYAVKALAIHDRVEG